LHRCAVAAFKLLVCRFICCAPHLLHPTQSLILVAAIVVLPTVWLRDLSLLSFLSVGGIFASLALLALVGWEGVAVTGFPHDRPPLVTWSGVPVSIGLFCFCFSGALKQKQGNGRWLGAGMWLSLR
jgi:amino acid permease